MAHIDLTHTQSRPMPLSGWLAVRMANIRQMLFAAIIAGGGIIVIAAVMMAAV